MITNLKAKLQDDLFALGDTSEQVAETLRAKGCKGKRICCYDCPVFHYLSSLGFVSPMVDDNYASCLDTNDYRTYMELSDGVAEFVNAFDAGEFDDLVNE